MLPATLREFGRGTHFLWNNLAHDLAKMQEVLLESATVDVAGENAALPTTPLRPGASTYRTAPNNYTLYISVLRS